LRGAEAGGAGEFLAGGDLGVEVVILVAAIGERAGLKLFLVGADQPVVVGGGGGARRRGGAVRGRTPGRFRIGARGRVGIIGRGIVVVGGQGEQPGAEQKSGQTPDCFHRIPTIRLLEESFNVVFERIKSRKGKLFQRRKKVCQEVVAR
jgi:hypothetical protein